MRFVIPIVVFVALCLGSAQADAASCSAFAVIKAYDADAKTVEVSFEKGNKRKFFPKPEGTPKNADKIPEECRRKVTKRPSFRVKPTGGKLSVTQVRSNFEAKMLNDTEDPAWLPAKLKDLIEAKTQVVVLIRPGVGKDASLDLTTIYLPITPEEEAEIKRIDDEAEDV
jgi:hypothetical protein